MFKFTELINYIKINHNYITQNPNIINAVNFFKRNYNFIVLM